MFQIRLHGRGGQGVVTAAEILSSAAFREGCQSQAFPSFGSERMGAPVVAFCRVDSRPIRLREPVTSPNCLIIQDATLLGQIADLFTGLDPAGYVLLNTRQEVDPARLSCLVAKLPEKHFITVDASEIARRHLGRPLPNAALLGAFAALTGQLTLVSVQEAIHEKFPGKAGDANAAAAAEAFAAVKASLARTGFPAVAEVPQPLTV
jgi:pyruvate ferredoxin oxidoreductase gamma subunit